jgi:hypothetical protein
MKLFASQKDQAFHLVAQKSEAPGFLLNSNH